MLLGRGVHDYDAATNARPEEVMRLFRAVIPTGIRHGTVTVIHAGYKIETTTYRTESGYSDARHPDSVDFSATLEEDLARRDFTINAMAWDPLSAELVDLFDGRHDLTAHLIRAVGSPRERFDEDGLRSLRAIRFATQLDFTIESATFNAIPPTLERLSLVAKERVRDELIKILVSNRPSQGFLLLEQSGILNLTIPELAACRGIIQKGLHVYDVLDHCLASMDASEKCLELRLASLFHDIGKPASMKFDISGEPTFHRHENVSAKMTETILRRLKFPTDLIKSTCHLILHHMFNYTTEWSDAAVRRFLARVGAEYVPDLLSLRMADASGMTGRQVGPEYLSEFQYRLDAVLKKEEAIGIKDLAVNGNDLVSIGIPRGPVLGKILGELLESVLDDPEQNEKSRLLSIAKAIFDKRILDS